MAISNKRRKQFEKKSPEEISTWLTTSLTNYFKSHDRYELEPFELFVGTGQSTALDFSNIYDDLSKAGQEKFRRALTLMFEQVGINSDTLDLWVFGAELVWTLGFTETRDVIKQRLAVSGTRKCLFAKNPHSASIIKEFLRNTVARITRD